MKRIVLLLIGCLVIHNGIAGPGLGRMIDKFIHSIVADLHNQLRHADETKSRWFRSTGEYEAFKGEITARLETARGGEYPTKNEWAEIYRSQAELDLAEIEYWRMVDETDKNLEEILCPMEMEKQTPPEPPPMTREPAPMGIKKAQEGIKKALTGIKALVTRQPATPPMTREPATPPMTKEQQLMAKQQQLMARQQQLIPIVAAEYEAIGTEGRRLVEPKARTIEFAINPKLSYLPKWSKNYSSKIQGKVYARMLSAYENIMHFHDIAATMPVSTIASFRQNLGRWTEQFGKENAGLLVPMAIEPQEHLMSMHRLSSLGCELFFRANAKTYQQHLQTAFNEEEAYVQSEKNSQIRYRI